MATVYSLLCWGGLTGKAVTASSSTDRITLTTHGIKAGEPVKMWIASGTAPTGLSAVVPYWGKRYNVDEFELYTDAGLTTRALFSTNGSSIVLKSDLIVSPATRLAAFGLSDLSRWGTRIYDSLKSWNSGRSGAGEFDTEVCEIGEAFSAREYSLTLNVPSLSSTIVSRINGIRTPAYHFGSVGQGYEATIDQAYYGGITTSRYYQTLDGFSVANRNITGYSGIDCIKISGKLNTVANMIVVYAGGAPLVDAAQGIYVSAIGARVNNNLVVGGHKTGINCGYNYPYGYICNNTSCGNGSGFYSLYTGANGFIYNNVSLGNTTNWATPGGSLEGGSNNAGGAGEAWVVGAGTRIEIVEASPFSATFVDYTGNNFRPKAGSALIDAGYAYYTIGRTDIADSVVPNYNNGGAVAPDIGCYEFDHGYGPWPMTCTLTLANVVVGSRINIRDQADTTTHYDALAATSTVDIPIMVYSSSLDNWRIRVRKASGSPNYIPYETLMTATAGAASIYVSQIPDE